MNVKQYRKILTVVLMLCAVAFFGCAERVLTGQLSTQKIAEEWSAEENYAQISCFFSEDAALTKEQIIPIEQQLVTALQEASEDAGNENGRTWVDCYSTQDELTIYSDRTSVTVRAFGVGGDFFLFHPLKLLSGNYFDGNDVNADGVVIDENVAWQLFGSNHVAGMTVEINGVLYPIRGVVRSDAGCFSEAAGEEKATVYVSYDILSKQTGGEEEMKQALTLDSYELLIKNPVHKFGVTALEKALGLDKNMYEMVENSTRFDFTGRLNVLKNFGIRSMNTKNIVFPYWENRAKAYEDVAALLLVLEFLCLIYPLVYAAGKLRWLWQHKSELWKKAVKSVVSFFRQLPVWMKKSKGAVVRKKKHTK